MWWFSMKQKTPFGRRAYGAYPISADKCRKEGDSNPRRVAPCLISNQVPSTSRPSFPIGICYRFTFLSSRVMGRVTLPPLVSLVSHLPQKEDNCKNCNGNSVSD